MFDEFYAGQQMSVSQIEADAHRYDLVWGAYQPAAWRAGNPEALISRYYILLEDNIDISGLGLQYWQTHHPDWILYACTASGTPTRDIAYTPGDLSDDVPLDIHNPDVLDYQINQSLIPYAQSRDYNAVAIDEVLFDDLMYGGNPNLGQTENTSEYACGVWNNDGTFTKHYSGRHDPQWTADILTWIATARRSLHAAGLSLVINHPGASPSDPNEQTLLANVDATVDEAGFTDYGNYQLPSRSSLFLNTLAYMEYAQKRGVAFVDIAKYALNGETTVTPDQIEFAIGTYLIGNEGGADLFVVASTGYGTEQYHPEFATRLRDPCGPYYGGPSYDPKNPNVYYRRFVDGISVVNAGSQIAEQAVLPHHAYTDIEDRPVTNPLTVPPNDAFVMTTSGGGCN